MDQVKTLDKLSKEIRLNFADECICSDQITSLTRDKLLKRFETLDQRYLPSEMSRTRSMIFTEENQWKKIVKILKTENYDINVLESHFDKALSWHYQAKIASTTIAFGWILNPLIDMFVLLVILFLLRNYPLILFLFLVCCCFMWAKRKGICTEGDTLSGIVMAGRDATDL